MHEALEPSPSGPATHGDPAATVAAIEAHCTRYETPCGNGRMVWRRWGEGPPLVLMHGGGGAWSHWIRNVVPLSERYAVWAIDIPGLGESATPEPLSIEAIADAVERGLGILIPGADPLDLVGFSFGTSIATILAARLQSRVNNLVLVAARFALHPRRVRTQLVSWRNIDDPAARLAVHRKNLEILMIADPRNIDALAVHLQSTNTGRARFAGPRLNPSEKMHEYLPQVRARGGITGISGAKDQGARSVMDKQESALLAIHPGARFQAIEDAGHWVQYEAAEQFNEALLCALVRAGAPNVLT
jgi:pimeloyl-ACP methyl ester carboxylesterase